MLDTEASNRGHTIARQTAFSDPVMSGADGVIYVEDATLEERINPMRTAKREMAYRQRPISLLPYIVVTRNEVIANASGVFDRAEEAVQARQPASRRVKGRAYAASRAKLGVFISYRREESAWPADRIYDRVRERYGSEQIFKDIDNIDLGDDFVEKINEAVASATVLLVLIGQRWLKVKDDSGRKRLDDPNDFVRLEVEAGLSRDDVRVIPILVDGARMPAAESLPDSMKKLARRQALKLDPERFNSDMEQLLKVLDRTLKTDD